MAKLACLDDEHRKLLAETKLKLDAAAKLMAELMETIEILGDEGMMKAIQEGREDIKAGRVKELRRVLKEEAASEEEKKEIEAARKEIAKGSKVDLNEFVKELS